MIINIKNENNKQKQRIRTKGKKKIFSQPRKSLHRDRKERKKIFLIIKQSLNKSIILITGKLFEVAKTEENLTFLFT